MKPFKFFLAVSLPQALLETFLLGWLIMFSLYRLLNRLEPYVFSSGFFLLCGACGMWMVLRTRLPVMVWWKQILWEFGAAILVSLLMGSLEWFSLSFGGWTEFWNNSNMGNDAGVALLLLSTGPGYLGTRVLVRIWIFWDRIRRKRMLWSLTHALLTVVVMVAVLGALTLMAVSPYYATAHVTQSSVDDPITVMLLQILLSIFPSTAIAVVLTLMALTVVLPPSAIFSFIVARRTTRRLERLTAAAGALRRGNYSARVAVDGEDELAQLQSDFNGMAEALERTLRDLQTERDRVEALLQSRRELVAAVSHELRTPVATVRAMLESDLDSWQQEPPVTLRHDLEIMDGEIQRLQRLIEDLFTLSRTEAGRLALECDLTEIGPLVKMTVEAIAPLAWENGRIEVVSEIPKTLPAACIDRERFQQILINLLRNGIRHTPPGGIVATVVSVEPEALCVEVRDTGEGIPAEELPHIWERFYRGSRARDEDGNGAGLGLALVKELTEAMQGSVTAESVVGQGSTFRVRLPIGSQEVNSRK